MGLQRVGHDWVTNTAPSLGWLLFKKKESSQGLGRMEALCIADGNVKWCSYQGKQKQCYQITAIPFLNTYSKELETGTWTDTCIPKFIAALFTIAKMWKQPKYQMDG